jgi:hypothetical protein
MRELTMKQTVDGSETDERLAAVSNHEVDTKLTLVGETGSALCLIQLEFHRFGIIA